MQALTQATLGLPDINQYEDKIKELTNAGIVQFIFRALATICSCFQYKNADIDKLKTLVTDLASTQNQELLNSLEKVIKQFKELAPQESLATIDVIDKTLHLSHANAITLIDLLSQKALNNKECYEVEGAFRTQSSEALINQLLEKIYLTKPSEYAQVIDKFTSDELDCLLNVIKRIVNRHLSSLVSSKRVLGAPESELLPELVESVKNTSLMTLLQAVTNCEKTKMTPKTLGIAFRAVQPLLSLP